MDGGPIADGNWHHVAFVVGAFSGALYVDGVNVTNQLWTGTAGPPTTNGLPLLIGRYTTISPSFTNAFSGQIDEVSLWTRALSTTDVQSMMNLPLVGNETGLTAYWRLDDAAGN